MSTIKYHTVVCTCLILITTGLQTGAAREETAALQPARVSMAPPGQTLATRAPLTPPALLGEFLRQQGASDATARSLRSVAEHRSPKTGILHLRFQQEVAGLRVHNAYVKAAFTPHGDLVHVIENLSPVSVSRSFHTSLDETEALAIVLHRLYPELRSHSTIAGREGNTTRFTQHDFFYDAPRVERVLIPQGGVFIPAFLVETWTRHSNQLHETLVDGHGNVLAVERRSYNDRYKIFPENPNKSPQTVVSGPGTGNTESPMGWLSPMPQNSVNIAGNNVHVYLDTDANDRPNKNGYEVTDGDFLTTANFAMPLSRLRNQSVAVQNVFYLTNLIHDTLYRHGFTETAGNFQVNNFGKGGREHDAVHVELQDSALWGNGMMTTPVDGRPPRMQIGLFQSGVLTINAPTSAVGSFPTGFARFGPPLSAEGISGEVVLVDDGEGTPTDACEAITNTVADKIALIDRGNCFFTTKVKNAQNAGALAAIIANNDSTGYVVMYGSDSTITIPSVSLSQADGQRLRSLTRAHVTVKSGNPRKRDGALDADLVWHEYGHGLTMRMIGDMFGGPIASAVAEGMSDALAIIIHEDDVFGEYISGHPGGARRLPYRNYPHTYATITGAEEHDDGEVYGAIAWRLLEIFQREGLSKDLLLDYMVDGMNYTPAHPTFENMREGLLAAVAHAGLGHDCLIWEAFAAYGVGVGARGFQLASGQVVIKESFVMPPQCNP